MGGGGGGVGGGYWRIIGTSVLCMCIYIAVAATY